MKTHWKKLDNPNYLGAYSLMDGETKELTLTIEKVAQEEVKTERGGELCRVAHFKGNHKPMILNNTNSKIIEKLYGTPYIEDWKDKSIVVYVAKFKAFGDWMEGLRIRETKPKTKKQLTPLTDDKLDSAIKFLKGGKTINDLKKFYSFSKELEEKLVNSLVDEA